MWWLSSMGRAEAGRALCAAVLPVAVWLLPACEHDLWIGQLDGGSGTVREECGNGTDDDADELIDETCFCGAGEVQACARGVATRGVGRCEDGQMTCEARGVEFGRWSGTCDRAVGPAAETCGDGTDEDCDGAIDEACPCTSSEERPCGERFATGACSPGVQRCSPSGRLSSCLGATRPRPELCGNGVDDDCDGEADERCDCEPVPEICANGADDDCDGETDEPACRSAGVDAGQGDGGGAGDGGATGDGGACSEDPCRLVRPQCGCSAGEACYRTDAMDNRVCAPAGSGGFRALCEQADDCQPGLACVRVSTTVPGACSYYCESNEDCPSAACFQTVAGGGTCAHGCDPVLQTGCPPELQCFLGTGTEPGATTPQGNSTCGSTGSRGAGESCADTGLSCGPGTACVGETCRQVCRVGLGDCSSGSCRSTNPASLIDGEEYGVCL